MVVATGDTHGEFGKLGRHGIGKFIGEGDYAIVCGDFGLCWQAGKEFDYNFRNFTQKKFTTLFVDGNHENFNMLYSYPVVEWNGGKAHEVVPGKVYHLMRGQVFTVEGRKIFTFGGASSHDVQGGIFNYDDPDLPEKMHRARRLGLPFRVKDISWWEQELPSEEEMSEGLANLDSHGWEVDYVVTHCIGSDMESLVGRAAGRSITEHDILNEYLAEIDRKLKYKRWFFGHYHIDKNMDCRHEVLYRGFAELK